MTYPSQHAHITRPPHQPQNAVPAQDRGPSYTDRIHRELFSDYRTHGSEHR